MTFAGDLIDNIEERFCTDPARVYATGISNGSALTGRLACGLDGRLAAVAFVAATIPANGCEGGWHVSVVATHPKAG